MEEVGRLTLSAANPMDEVGLSLTSSLKDTKAPVVVSFKTASATTGAKYSQVQGPTQLKLVFTDTTILEIYQSDDIASTLEQNSAEDELSEARQYCLAFGIVRPRHRSIGISPDPAPRDPRPSPS